MDGEEDGLARLKRKRNEICEFLSTCIDVAEEKRLNTELMIIAAEINAILEPSRSPKQLAGIPVFNILIIAADSINFQDLTLLLSPRQRLLSTVIMKTPIKT